MPSREMEKIDLALDKTIVAVEMIRLGWKEDRKKHFWIPAPAVKGVTMAMCGYGPWDGRHLENSMEHDICEKCLAHR